MTGAVPSLVPGANAAVGAREGPGRAGDRPVRGDGRPDAHGRGRRDRRRQRLLLEHVRRARGHRGPAARPAEGAGPGTRGGRTRRGFGRPARPILPQPEGWAVGRENGDPFTPNPAMEFGNPLSPPSTDYPQISGRAGTDTVDAGLPSNGGYNYQITLNSPGHIQVYNAAFAPDTNGGKPTNNCENNRQGSPVAAIGPCVTTGAFFGEYWNMDLTKKNQYDAMEYTLFRVPNVLMRSSDVEIDKLTVYPIDASNWNQ